jgi:hypothetical protein
MEDAWEAAPVGNAERASETGAGRGDEEQAEEQTEESDLARLRAFPGPGRVAALCGPS